MFLYVCWKEGNTSTIFFLPNTEDTALFLNVRTSKILLWPEWQVAREVRLNLGREVGWHVPKSHAADVSEEVTNRTEGAFSCLLFIWAMDKNYPWYPLVIRRMKAPLCRNSYEPTAQWNVTSFFSMAHLMPFWQMLFFLLECLISSTNQFLFFFEIPAVSSASLNGTLEFSTIPISPLINVSSPSRCWGICKVTVSRQGIVQSLLQSHPEETQYGWFCRNGLKDGQTWKCFFPISWYLILLGCNTWVAEHVINPAD